MITTPYDEAVALLRDATNAVSEAEDRHDLPLSLTRDLQNLIDAALREAIRLQERAIRLLEEDGPDPDRQRDDQWDDSFERSDR